jgi:hypothetical protein
VNYFFLERPPLAAARRSDSDFFVSSFKSYRVARLGLLVGPAGILKSLNLGVLFGILSSFLDFSGLCCFDVDFVSIQKLFFVDTHICDKHAESLLTSLP